MAQIDISQIQGFINKPEHANIPDIVGCGLGNAFLRTGFFCRIIGLFCL